MMRQDRFTEQAQEVLQNSQQMVRDQRHAQWDVEHVFLALLQLKDGLAKELIEHLNVNIDDATRLIADDLARSPKLQYEVVQIYTTPRIVRMLESANAEAERLQDDFVGIEHLLIAISEENDGATSRFFKSKKISKESIYTALREIRGTARVNSPTAESNYKSLAKYSIDLTDLARKNELDPVVGREVEIDRLIQILNRRTKNNPVLIGEAGVGKTAVVEGLAQRIIDNNVPDKLKNKRLLALDLPGMLAGSKFRGEFEERLQSVIREVKEASGEIILFLDEMHNLVGAGGADGAIDAGNMLKPSLARGEFKVVGATTLNEYRQSVEKDPALERRFSPVYVDEPDINNTVKILEGIKHKYEEHHGITISKEAINDAAHLSERYITERQLPDKAIDLIDEASSRKVLDADSLNPDLKEMKNKIDQATKQIDSAALRQDYEEAAKHKSKLAKLKKDYDQFIANSMSADENIYTINSPDIATVVAQVTGIPVDRLLEKEANKLINMESSLHSSVIGQDNAIRSLADAIRRARSRLKDPKRPIGSFIFVGPTGVGKTHLAKGLAEYLFDDEDALIRLDMSEFQEKHTVSRLFGAPPGYVGYDEAGELTEAVRRRPYQVILFDEIEKAHPDIFNTLLQVLDNGRLTDSHGRIVDFRNTIIILTSNLGTGANKTNIGFKRTNDQSEIDSMVSGVESALKNTFRPEFLNRIDEIVVFEPLTENEIKAIAEIEIAFVANRLSEQGIRLEVKSKAINKLVEQGYDLEYGARPLKRTIERHIENPLATDILAGKFQEGQTVIVDWLTKNKSYTFKVEDRKSETKTKINS